MSFSQEYYRYWGKARSGDEGGAEYHLLPYHGLDVAAVGWQLLGPKKEICQSLASQLDVNPEWLQEWFSFCLMLHDIGKFFRAFQNLAPDLSENLVSSKVQCVYVKRHDTLGYSLWRLKLRDNLKALFPTEVSRSVDGWMEIVCGHHGQPPELIRPIEPYLLLEDEQATEAYIKELATWALPDLSPLAGIEKSAFRRVSWQLAGVAVLADWLGSNQAIFNYCDVPEALQKYWQATALAKAQKAIDVAQIEPPTIKPFLSIRQQFDFIQQPTPLQEMAQSIELSESQQLFILEDVTGAGKTEAAMVLVHRLMGAGLAKGVYVGLPTMATANAMYERMEKSYRSLYTEQALPSLVLSHGARDLSAAFKKTVQISDQATDKNYDQQDLSASAYCNQWLADNRKKALLADVGVGTIDQALLGILPARHQSLRLLGLCNKVLLVDEVHAFDPYMRQLLAALLQAHAAQGGCAILLSATLPYRFRRELVNAFATGTQQSQKSRQSIVLKKIDAYPLITHWGRSLLREIPVATRASVQRRVKVERLDDESGSLGKIHQAVNQGQCICWIRNTVKDAHQAYQALLAQPWIKAEKLTLFHSRYAMIDRQAIEQNVLRRFGKKSTGVERASQVLIATQVVEQSLDLDFDVMISDLAPVDLLIQRAGRLQRHTRSVSGDILGDGSIEQRAQPILFVLAPDSDIVKDKNWLRTLLPGTQAVYPNVGMLWLTLKVLLKNQGFTMPGDARGLVEGVYGELAENRIPEVLEKASNDALAEQRAQQGMGEFNCLKLDKGYTHKSAIHSGGWDEDIRIPTRLGNDTLTVALARIEEGNLVPYADTKSHSWALSQISLPRNEWESAQKLIPPGMVSMLDEAKEAIPALKWLEVLPLVDEVGRLYGPVEGWGNPHERGERLVNQ